MAFELSLIDVVAHSNEVFSLPHVIDLLEVRIAASDNLRRNIAVSGGVSQLEREWKVLALHQSPELVYELVDL